MNPLLHLTPAYLQSEGILDWGYTEDPVPHSLSRYEQWVDNSHHQPLNYLADHRRELRRDLRKVYPDFQSALVFLFSYRPAKKFLLEQGTHKIAAYALGFEGEDYHHSLKRKLDSIFEALKTHIPELEQFISLDAQPVLERDLAYRAGLGWFGKNSMLIHQKEGSYFIIGSILLNRKLPLTIGKTDVDHCGQCLACIEACPTQAIDPETRTLKADKCIATYTIETFKDVPPPKGFDLSRGEIFGCDICQDICPWNRKPLQREKARFKLKPASEFLREWFFQSSLSKLNELMEKESNRSLKRKLAGTPFDRPGRVGWLKTLKHLLQGHPK